MSSFGKTLPGGIKAVIHCRVSTKEQTQKLSLATLRQVCEAFCERAGLEVVRVFMEEGESAKTTERTEFQHLLTFCREQKGQLQHVVVYSLTRFARNNHDHVVVSAFLKNKLEELRAAKDRLVDAFVHRHVIDQGTYNEQVGRVTEEIALTEMAAHEAKLEELDVEGVVAFAQHVLANAARLWTEFSLDQKQRLQRVLFPEGVAYRDGEFGTAATSLIFSLLHAVPSRNEGQASPAGFEPTLPA